MKFKKSISFALTLCMVLSLFATFVIPASAAEKAVTATVTDGSVKILTEKLALLCDGNDAASATAFSDAGLVAFENTGFTHTDGVDAAVPATIEFVLDLGEATGISGAYMTFFRDDASMVALPSGVVFEGSVDGKYWYDLNAGGVVAPSADDKTVATAKADFSTRAVYEVRYVKATATFKNGWIFAGELGVLAAGNSGVGAIAPDYAFAYTADSTPSSNCIGIFGAGTYDLATSEEGKYLKSGQLLIAKEVADGVYVTSMNKVNAWPDGHSGEVTIAEDEILVSIVTGGALVNNETDYYTTAKWIARGLPNEGTVIVVDKEASTVAFYPANYEVPEVVVTSKVVTDWNVASYKDSSFGASAAIIFTDAEAYLATGEGYSWWSHVSFKPTDVAGVYEVVEYKHAAGTAASFEIAEGGFVWMSHDTAEAGTPGAYVQALVQTLSVGDLVEFVGVDFANKTAAADATAGVWVDPNAPVNVALGKDYVLSGCGNRASYYGDLTDGASVSALTNNNNVDWFGFYCNGDNMADINAPEKVGTVVIDLGAMYDISSMRTKTIAMPSWGIAAAGAINFYASADGVEYTLVGSGVVTTDEGVGYWAGTDCEVIAQFVKLEVKLAGTFAFINEFEVYGKEAPKSEIVLPEDVQGFGDPYGGVDVLVDGETAEGKFGCFDGNQAYLVAVMNTNAEANVWDVTIALKEETTFNTVTVYYWDEANSCIYMPTSTTVTVNGETYTVENTTESEVGAEGKVHAVVVDLGKDVTASSYTVSSTMAAEQANFFNMMTEVAVSLEETVVEPGIEIVLPEGTGITIPDGYGATDILLDGYTGVGEITAHDGNHDKLVCLRNGTTDVESEYSLKVTLDKETAFNVVTLYILSHTGGNVGLPKAVTVNINGVDYEAAIAGEDASVVAIEVKLEEAVSATGFTVDVVMNSGDVKYNMYSEIAVSLVEDDDESYKDTYVHADGVNVGTIQQLGDAWADKLTLDFWYLVEEDDATVTVSVVADDKVILENDTQLRVWVDADMSDKTRTTLFDVKVIDGVATVVRADNYDAAVKSVSYEVIGKDYKLVLVLDKAALTIDGEYGLNVQLGQSNSTTMHSIKYDNVTGEGATYAPWNTTEFYEVFGKAPEAPVTSQVVTDWNPDKWGNSFGGATGAFIYTDADIYADADILWWRHVAFKPSAVAGVYEVAAVRAPSEDPYLTIPEGGFVWTAWSSAGDTPESSGAYALAFMGDLKVGDFVYFVGVDFAAQTTTADATAITVESIMDLNLLVSHNYNYNWHCFEGQFITNTIADANGNYLVKAGDAPNMSIAEEDILYVVELVDGAYLVTAFVTGTAIADVVIPDGGFLYYITANCTGYESVSKGELVGSYLLIGDINLNSSFAIDTQAGQAAYAISAVKSGKVFDIGDLNLNGEIDATDYAILRKLVLGTLTAEDIGDIAYARADVNGDKVVNARDYYLVKRAFLGTYVIPGWEQDDAE